jgi:hypothetical protein
MSTHGDSSEPLRRTLPLYLACYALWLGFAALAVWLILALRPVLFLLSVRLRFNPWQIRAVDNFGFVTLGLLWLVCVLVVEHYFRQGVVKHRFWRRAARVFTIMAVALGLCYGLQLLLG